MPTTESFVFHERRIQMTTAEIETGFKEIKDLFRETDKIHRWGKKLEKYDPDFARLKSVFSSPWSEVLDSLFEAGIAESFIKRDIALTKLFRRIDAKKNGRQIEIDFLITNAAELVVGEVKTSLKVDDVKEFLKKMEDFFFFFPEYKNYKIYGAVIGLHKSEAADKFAYRQGLFVFKVGGEGTLKMLNDDAFQPVDFGKMNDWRLNIDY